MSVFNIQDFLTDDSNHIEVFFCPNTVDHKSSHSITVARKQSCRIVGLGNGSKQELKEYYHNDMTYVYDLSNDGQRVYRKLAQQEYSHKNVYAVSYIEEVIPTHRFPCTNEITHETSIHRTTYRINNRTFFIHDQEGDLHYYYIRYQHSQNVDIRKMQADMDKTFTILARLRLIH